MEKRAAVIRPEFAPGRRIITISDIHGNLPFFKGLLEKIKFSTDDILVLDGDLLEKGAESLALLRYIMELEKTHTVYSLCGNLDELVLRFIRNDQMDSFFFGPVYLPQHPESILRQLAREGGFDQIEDLPRLRADLRRTYPQIWDWLEAMPTILETEHLFFVHGGVSSLDHPEEKLSWSCMKNDDFLGQGHSFGKWVIVGHWPVTLYHDHRPSAAPIILPDRRICSIDGGCVLKLDGQLNALILPSEESDDFTWEAYDGLPEAVALEDQKASEDSVNIRWGRSELELLEPGDEVSLCRHKETGRVLNILNSYLRNGPMTYHADSPVCLWCEDSTDYALPVKAGDRLSVVAVTEHHGALCKKNGVTGWYYGRLDHIPPKS